MRVDRVMESEEINKKKNVFASWVTFTLEYLSTSRTPYLGITSAALYQMS